MRKLGDLHQRENERLRGPQQPPRHGKRALPEERKSNRRGALSPLNVAAPSHEPLSSGVFSFPQGPCGGGLPFSYVDRLDMYRFDTLAATESEKHKNQKCAAAVFQSEQKIFLGKKLEQFRRKEVRAIRY